MDHLLEARFRYPAGLLLFGVKMESPNLRTPPKEETMVKAYLNPALAGAFLVGTATAALAVTGEFGNMCTMGLATGKDIQTDCSINSQVQGKTYCFGSKEAM